MAIGLVGRKRGMTRIFSPDGTSEAVSVVEIEHNRVTQVKTVKDNGYLAIQVTAGNRPASRVNKPMAGHFAKAKVTAGEGLWEFRVDDTELSKDNDETNIVVGHELKVDIFTDEQFVDVTGISRGKGFAGTIKRHNFAGQNATHGNSLSHRVAGSTGQNQTPGRVFKGRKMAGQMGNKRHTTQNLQIKRVDSERNLLLIKGAIPGAPGSYVLVRPAVKKKVKGAK